jgi:hypothetical protein
MDDSKRHVIDWDDLHMRGGVLGRFSRSIRSLKCWWCTACSISQYYIASSKIQPDQLPDFASPELVVYPGGHSSIRTRAHEKLFTVRQRGERLACGRDLTKQNRHDPIWSCRFFELEGCLAC